MLDQDLINKLRLGEIILVNNDVESNVSKIREIIMSAFPKNAKVGIVGTGVYYFRYDSFYRGWLASSTTLDIHQKSLSKNVAFISVDLFYIKEEVDEC